MDRTLKYIMESGVFIDIVSPPAPGLIQAPCIQLFPFVVRFVVYSHLSQLLGTWAPPGLPDPVFCLFTVHVIVEVISFLPEFLLMLTLLKGQVRLNA